MGKSIKNRHNKNGVYIKWSNSNKRDKRIANRRFRRRETVDERLAKIEREDMFHHNYIKEVSNVYDFSSDGLAHYLPFSKSLKIFEKITLKKFKNK